jgi:hypothetical protein
VEVLNSNYDVQNQTAVDYIKVEGDVKIILEDKIIVSEAQIVVDGANDEKMMVLELRNHLHKAKPLMVKWKSKVSKNIKSR